MDKYSTDSIASSDRIVYYRPRAKLKFGHAIGCEALFCLSGTQAMRSKAGALVQGYLGNLDQLWQKV